MNTVPPKGKHLSRVTVDDIAFYYAQKCRVMPALHQQYIDGLTNLEGQGKVCFTPEAILERYTMNVKKKIAEKIRKYAGQKR